MASRALAPLEQLDWLSSPAEPVEAATVADVPAAEPEPPAVEPVAPTAEEEEERGQLALFDVTEYWRAHWGGMPEFVQDDLSPVRSIIVHFETAADADRFAALVEQTIGPNVKSLWYPEAEIVRYADKRYGRSDE
jgi:hypothetical protein